MICRGVRTVKTYWDRGKVRLALHGRGARCILPGSSIRHSLLYNLCPRSHDWIPLAPNVVCRQVQSSGYQVGYFHWYQWTKCNI